MRHPGSIVSQDTIEREVYADRGELESNAVAVLIYGIRQKFGREIIRNVRGAGWLVPRQAA
jgi:DNA-binding response OmpR family regulator